MSFRYMALSGAAAVTATIALLAPSASAATTTDAAAAACDASKVKVSVSPLSSASRGGHTVNFVIDNQSDCATTSWLIEWDRPANITDTGAFYMQLTKKGDHYTFTGQIDSVVPAHSDTTTYPVYGKYTGNYTNPKNLKVTPQF